MLQNEITVGKVNAVTGEKKVSEIAKVVGQITVDEVSEHAFKPGIYQAQVRQSIVKKYPTAVVNNSATNGLFSAEDLGIETKDFVENRVAFITVRSTDTIESVQEFLDTNFPSAKIWKRIGFKPFFTSEEISAINNDLITAEDLAKKQVVVNGSTGELILANGQTQYRRLFFDRDGLQADIDARISTAVEAVATV